VPIILTLGITLPGERHTCPHKDISSKYPPIKADARRVARNFSSSTIKNKNKVVSSSSYDQSTAVEGESTATTPSDGENTVLNATGTANIATSTTNSKWQSIRIQSDTSSFNTMTSGATKDLITRAFTSAVDF